MWYDKMADIAISNTEKTVMIFFFFFHLLLASGLTPYPFVLFPRNTICLNTASFLYAVHGPVISFPLSYYGHLLLFMRNPYAASSLLLHSPAIPLYLS